jgi:hypothetical protein
MAFKDITKVMYDGKVKIDYKDKAHRYYARPRVNWDLPEDDPKAWGKIMYPKGTTTLMDETLEKKGLMQWPKQVALRELFGFYNSFQTTDPETGEPKAMPASFSKGVGTMWNADQTELAKLSREEILELVCSADKAWQRRQKQGADIGSVVHDAIEHFIKEIPFDIEEQYLWNIKEADYETEELREKAMLDAPLEIEMAKTAFLQFQKWWYETTPTLYGAEDLLYSLKHNICGTYDGDIGIQAQYHPVFADQGQKIIRVTADWKTSKASQSKEAAMPEGVNYGYFVQSAIYEIMRREMGMPANDDLLIVSARKDGGFTLVYASELGLTVGDCIEWAQAVIICWRAATKTKAGLWQHAKPVEGTNV